MKNISLLLALLLCVLTVSSQETKNLLPLIQNVYDRDHQVLNGYWHYLVDPLETGYYDYRRQPTATGFFMDQQTDNVKTFKEYDFDTAPVMAIPGDWNTQNAELFNYEGTLWYKHTFDYQPSDKRAFLYFGAANYETKIYVNTKKVGEHEGGYTPFNFDITSVLKKGSNTLIVKVDNKRRIDAIPTNNFDWFNYGGITRDVLLVEVPATFVQTYSIQLKKGSGSVISGSVKLNVEQAAQKVTVEIPELKIKKEVTTNDKGEASFEVKSNPVLWCPENPKRYAVSIVTPTDKVTDQIGFRTIETKGREILLNGKPIFLKGISVHEEAAFRNGRIYSVEEDRTLLTWAKELGCNFVRLAHYPHNEQMIREAEKMGIMVWSEIPVYWTIKWEDPNVYANALNQLSEMMERDKNRANVIIWSIANETPHSDPRDTFLSNLAIYAKKKDSTRLISMAMERADKSPTTLSVKDNLNKYVDVISFNEYVGWYDGTTEKIDRVKWGIDYDKPLIISEFGGEAVFGNRGSVTDLWTEDNQADLYTKTLKMIDERMPKVSGISPWILKDFRSSRRLLPGVQDGFNRKGVISDKGQKKKSFYVLQQWYFKK
jgi:beta-glucuronidase